MPEGKFKLKKRWIVLAVIIVILILAFIFIRLKFVPPITMVYADSYEPGKIHITWHDVEDDKIYCVYWSNKPKINIHDPTTYRGVKVVSGKELKLDISYDVVYFRISKEGRKTREFELVIFKDKTFTANNVQASFYDNGINLVISARVLQNPDIYHIYQKLSNGTVYVQDFDVLNQERAEMKLQRFPDSLIFLTYEKEKQESEPIFLAYNEKIHPSTLN